MSAIRVAHVATVDMTHRFLLLPQMRRLQEEGYEVAAVSAPGRWRSAIEAAGIRFIRWPHATRAWKPGSDAMAFRALLRLLRSERFDLVHTHTPKAGVMGRIAARMAGVPCVVNTVHGLYATPEDPLRRRLPVLAAERLAARFSDLELYQSEEDLRWAERLGLVRSDQGLLLGNGTDLQHFEPSSGDARGRAETRRELGIPERALVVGTVGRPVAEKGYREFADAARMVTQALPDARFLAVGGVSPAPSQYGARVTFTGWREDVRDLLAAMDLFVLASWREGVPRSAIEAAAMGLPLVLTNIRGCREVCRDGIEGRLVPPRNAERLAQATTDLLRDPEARERMGEAARTRAEERFDERRVIETVLTSYEVLLRRKGLSRGAMAPAIRLRPARVEDAAALARIHRDALPGAFLPALGDRFLRRLYRALAADRRAVALVAENGSGVIGFATGVPSVRAFYRRFLIRHGLPAAVAAVPRLFRKDVRRNARETASYPKGNGSLPPAELLSIAVDRGWGGYGIGRRLARGIVTGLGQRGVSEGKVVVGAENKTANRLYAAVGFEPAGRISVHRGEDSNVWVWRWPS